MANLQIRVDDTLKAQADSLFASIGMDTSSAVRVFLKQSVLRGGIPFELVGDPYLPYLQEADARARAGEAVYTEEEFRAFGAEYRERMPADGNTELTLFLKLSADGVTFVPAGENALRWGSPTDAAGIRLREALRVYGNKHPREWLGLG